MNLFKEVLALDNDKILHIVQVALMAAIMVVLSLIPGIPLGPTPIVLENLGVMLAAILLGIKRGTWAVLLFILLKVIGLSGIGGLALLIGPTSGYVYGWILVPLFTGLGFRYFKNHLNLWIQFLIVAVVNVLVVDIIGGSLGLWAINGLPIVKAMLYNVLFIPGDVIKAFLAALVGGRIMKSSRFHDLLR